MDKLEEKLRDNLYQLYAKDMRDARDWEIYKSLSLALKLRIGKDWNKSLITSRQEKRRYLLSFEYSIGNNLKKNIINLDAYDQVEKIMLKNKKDLDQIFLQDNDMELGYGDLGYLTNKLIEDGADRGENIYSYGLRYRRGMLKQEIVEGQQVEKPDDWKGYKNPWEHEKGFSHLVEGKDFSLRAVPYDVPIVGYKNKQVNTLRLWKSESLSDMDFQKFSQGEILSSYDHINRANAIVEFLYPQDSNYQGQKLRYAQEYFYASASIQDIIKKYRKYSQDRPLEKMDDLVNITIMGIHPLIALVIFIDILTNKYGMDFDEAKDLAKRVFTFINVSVTPESFERWSLDLIEDVSPKLIATIKKLDRKNENKYFPLIENNNLNLFNLAMSFSHEIYLLSVEHYELFKTVIGREAFQAMKDKIHIMELKRNKKKYLKENNYRLFQALETGNFQDMEKIKQANKLALLNKLVDEKNINPQSIFNMNFGVFHEYNRQLLSALSIGILYYQLKNDCNLDVPERTYFFGGKSYPNYYAAKEIIKFINALAHLINKDIFIKDKIKIVFIENYNVSKSKIIIPGADIRENLTIPSMKTNYLNDREYLANGAVVLSSRNHKRTDDYIYEFGSSFENIKNRNYRAHDLINSDPLIKDSFIYLSKLNYSDLPYDFNTIIELLLKYDDGFFVLKDLRSHHKVHGEICQDYMDQAKWMRTIKKSIGDINEKY